LTLLHHFFEKALRVAVTERMEMEVLGGNRFRKIEEKKI